MRSRIAVKIIGHLKIHEYRTLDDFEMRKNFTVLLNKRNAVHRENASVLIARALTDREHGSIFYMYFGNGGSTIDPLGNVIFSPPNVEGAAADLYNTTYFENVDDRLGAPPGNIMEVDHTTTELVSSVVIHCVAGKNEPYDGTTDEFVFNEIGLKTADDLLVTHVTFTPVTKQPSRILEIIYTLAITINN